MTTENLKAKEQLRDLIDAYAYLGDQKKISQQMDLFTKDAVYKVYMNGLLAAEVSGTEALEKEFNGHASQVKTYFTLNGQHTITIKEDTVIGVSFSQLKMVRESEKGDVLTDYSVRYDDQYVRQDEKWFIKQRIGHFIIVESRELSA